MSDYALQAALGYLTAAIGITVLLIAATCRWCQQGETANEAQQVQPRDERAPSGMSDIQYNGWKARRDIADDYIASLTRRSDD